MSWDPKRKHGRSNRQTAAWVIARAGGLCQIGGPDCIRIATEDDHIVPFARGGGDGPANHQAACTVCHAAKTRREQIEGKTMRAARLKRSAGAQLGRSA